VLGVRRDMAGGLCWWKRRAGVGSRKSDHCGLQARLEISCSLEDIHSKDLHRIPN
jgi:hypothetical protein